jgi:hypothetical protein
MTDFPKLQQLQEDLDNIRSKLIELTDRVADLANEIHAALEKQPQPDDDAEPDEVEPIVPEVPDEPRNEEDGA